MINKPEEVVTAVPYNPPKPVITKTVQVMPPAPPPVVDIPEQVDTSLYDCTIDKSLTSEFEKTYFTPAKENVEVDFPPTDIGCCPSSKPMSSDLPIGNIPMCYAEQRKTYLRKNV